MRRREAEHKKDNMERWLLTYADLITLLMIFFILMYTISSVNSQKFKQIATSLNATLVGKGNSALMESPGPSIIPGESGQQSGGKQDFPIPQPEGKSLDEVQGEVEAFIQGRGLGNQVQVNLEERGLVVSFQDTILFPSGSADLTPQSRPIVKDVGQILAKIPNFIRIEGHTDSRPINTARFPSNWELSVSRASTVVRELIRESGLKPQNLSATGYGEYRPVKPNDSAVNMSANRRVDIVILSGQFNPVEPQLKTGGK